MQYPELKVQLTLNDRFIDPIEEGFDITIRIAKPQESLSLITHVITTAQRVLCASPNYLESRGVPTHPRELQNHSCLHYGQIGVEDQWILSDPDGEQ